MMQKLNTVEWGRHMSKKPKSSTNVSVILENEINNWRGISNV